LTDHPAINYSITRLSNYPMRYFAAWRLMNAFIARHAAK